MLLWQGKEFAPAKSCGDQQKPKVTSSAALPEVKHESHKLKL